MQPGPEDPYNQQPPGGGGGYPPPGGDGGSYPPPGSGAGGYPPPSSGAGGYPPPGSGAGGYPPPGGSGGGYGPPGGGGFPPPGGGAYPPPGGGAQNTVGLIAMILGILSIPLACCGWGGLIFGIAGGVLGWMGKQKAEQGLANNRGQAMAGLICGGIGLVLGIVVIILSFTASAIDWQQYVNQNS